MSLPILVALCDILDCTPNDLIEPVAEMKRSKATGTSGVVAKADAVTADRKPRRAEIRRQ